MTTITIQDIERDPCAFLRRVEAGASFLVVRGEQPLAEVRPLLVTARQPRPYGLGAGEFTVPVDFDRHLPDDVLPESKGP